MIKNKTDENKRKSERGLRRKKGEREEPWGGEGEGGGGGGRAPGNRLCVAPPRVLCAATHPRKLAGELAQHIYGLVVAAVLRNPSTAAAREKKKE